MLDLLENSLNPQTVMMVLAAIAAAATVLTLAMPIVFANPLDKRMMANIIAAEALAGKDNYCMNYLKAYRSQMFDL